jgi:hypothetical protein
VEGPVPLGGHRERGGEDHVGVLVDAHRHAIDPAAGAVLRPGVQCRGVGLGPTGEHSVRTGREAAEPLGPKFQRASRPQAEREPEGRIGVQRAHQLPRGASTFTGVQAHGAGQLGPGGVTRPVGQEGEQGPDARRGEDRARAVLLRGDLVGPAGGQPVERPYRPAVDPHSVPPAPIE